MTLQTGIAIAELVGVVLLIAALNNPKKFLKNLIKISIAANDNRPEVVVNTILDELEEEEKEKVAPRVRWA